MTMTPQLQVVPVAARIDSARKRTVAVAGLGRVREPSTA